MAAREQIDVRHPVNADITGVTLVMLHSGPRRPGVDARNAVVLTRDPLLPDQPATWTGILDRSPCGTGTSARMAVLHARGDLAIGADVRHRSIIDSLFIGRLTGTTVEGIPAVLPTITGRTRITGRAQWILDADDPYPAATRSPTCGAATEAR
jgi:proline racemase